MKPNDVYRSDKNSIIVIKEITQYKTVFGTSYFEDSYRDWQIGQEHLMCSGWKLIGTKNEYPEYFL